MRYRTIDVDEEVFAALAREAIPFKEPTPNDVLRRLVLSETPGTPAGKPGWLMPQLEAGLLIAGDRLVHVQPRKHQSFTAEVTADGYVQLTDGSKFATPSGAFEACAGFPANGWDRWTVERTGKPLRDHRDTGPRAEGPTALG